MNIRTSLLPLFFLFSLFAAGGEEFSVPAIGYFLNLPDKWIYFNTSDPGKVAFTDEAHSAVLQVLALPADKFSRAFEIYEYIKAEFNAEGDGAPFLFSGRDAFFSDLTFHSGSIEVRGYFIFIDCINGEEHDFALLTFAPIDLWGKYHDYLLSALDSFCIGEKEKLVPGPVSQFYYPYPGKNPIPITLTINNKTFTTFIDEKEIEATQVLIEREARILCDYQGDYIDAWRRYYKLIYRDNYNRLNSYSDILRCAFHFNGKSRHESVSDLLSWIQGFNYNRTGTLSDLTPPLASAFTSSGDCDTRALLFVILLHHMEIDSILLVSTEYGHSAVGIYVEGPGARISYNGKNYLFAEVTKKVDLGLVAQDMANPAGWIPIAPDK